MKIWIDADACPNSIKEIIFKASNRLKVETILVANHWINLPKSTLIKFIKVSKGLDAADHYIAKNMDAEDLVITADIPLASDVVNNNGFALNPRGTFYTKANIDERLAVRDLMDDLRGSGQVSGGPPALGNKEKQKFAAELDKFLAKKCQNN